jgi:hypothetical protein
MAYLARPLGSTDSSCKHYGGEVEMGGFVACKLMDDLCLQDGGPFDGMTKYEIINPAAWRSWIPLFPQAWLLPEDSTTANKYGHFVSFLVFRFLALYLSVGTGTMFVTKGGIVRVCNFIDGAIFPRDSNRSLGSLARLSLAKQVYKVCVAILGARTQDLRAMGLGGYFNHSLIPGLTATARDTALISIAKVFITRVAQTGVRIANYEPKLSLMTQVALHLHLYLDLNGFNHLTCDMCTDIVLKIRLWLADGGLRTLAFEQFPESTDKLAIRMMPAVPITTRNNPRMVDRNNRDNLRGDNRPHP